jgi:hypothetical protein
MSLRTAAALEKIGIISNFHRNIFKLDFYIGGKLQINSK